MDNELSCSPLAGNAERLGRGCVTVPSATRTGGADVASRKANSDPACDIQETVLIPQALAPPQGGYRRDFRRSEGRAEQHDLPSKLAWRGVARPKTDPWIEKRPRRGRKKSSRHRTPSARHRHVLPSLAHHITRVVSVAGGRPFRLQTRFEPHIRRVPPVGTHRLTPVTSIAG